MDQADRLFETIANYTYDWETWFSSEGQPLWVNPAVERMTGFSVEECLAMPDYPLPLIHPDDRAMIAEHLASAGEGSSGNDVEFRIQRKDGGVGWAAVSWQPILDQGMNGLGFRTSMRDISQRKTAEETLRRAMDEAERAANAKSRFLAAASHDLRQPLQAMSMFVGALSHMKSDSDSAEVIDSIRKCLRSADELLDALLDVSRLDAGVFTPNPRDFAVADLLEMLETAYQGTAAEKGLRLRTVASDAIIHSDPVMLGRMIQNLVSNAIRYTERGGVLVGCRRGDRRLRLEVWDTGVGIPPDQLDLIFEEFYQIGNPERDRTRGLGLGLAIVRRQSRLLNARVRVKSEPGRGSVFSVELPLAKASDVEAAPFQADGPVGRLEGLTLVAIDDEPLQLEAIRAFLSASKCTVVTGTTPIEAAAKLKGARHLPDAIIADYRLRDHMTGVEAIDLLRQNLGAQIPGILLTGDTEPARILEAQSSGYALLHKPIEPVRLIGAIIEAVAPVL